jgi:hypothetical protein
MKALFFILYLFGGLGAIVYRIILTTPTPGLVLGVVAWCIGLLTLIWNLDDTARVGRWQYHEQHYLRDRRRRNQW